MKYISTRGDSPPLGLSGAIQMSLAPDGGLYVPEFFPQFELTDFEGSNSWPSIGKKVLQPFFEGDGLEPDLTLICESAFDFPLVLKNLANHDAALELFHGPTAAFKDVGARFLAECVARMEGRRMVLVATSGDTGGAVAAAFHDKPETEVVILFPKGKVSPRQEAQLTCWGGNVRAFAVRGDFDDCQHIVKAAFADPELKARQLLSANSINLGRLLPQTVYYAAASIWYKQSHGVSPGFIVPTGNLGNAVACFWAMKMGFPIREIVMATNANHAVPDYFVSGKWLPHLTISTLANAMDVGNPSNMERLRHLYQDIEQLRSVAKAFSVSDAEISEAISCGEQHGGAVWCPHTAAAIVAREKLQSQGWIVVATAHPAKFESIVEPLIGHKIGVPESLALLLEMPQHVEEIEPSLDQLKRRL
jgi:threonine synthase